MKKIILFLFFTFILSTVCYADLNTNLTAYLSFNTNYDDSLKNYNATVGNTPVIITDNCINSGCSQLSGGSNGNDYINWGSVPLTNNFTLNCWIYFNGTYGSNPTYQPFYGRAYNSAWANPLHMAYQTAQNQVHAFVGVGNPHSDETVKNGKITINKWHMVTVILNSTHIKYYENATLFTTNAHNGATDNTGLDFILGSRTGFATGYMNGSFDECGLWHRQLSQAELEQLYNSGLSLPYPFTVSPVLNINTNLINATQNYEKLYLPVYFNGTLTSTTTDIYNCSIYFNYTLQNTSEYNLTVNNFYNITIPENVENWFNINISCNNFEANDSVSYWYNIDTKNVNIITNFVNNTEYTQLDSLTAQFNISDTNLYAYNISVLDVNGALWSSENYFLENISANNVSVNLNYILTDLGNFTIMVQGWDSHNPVNKPVKTLEWYNDSDNIFTEEMVITGDIKFSEPYTYFYLEDNKYKFKVTFNEDSLNHSFLIYTNSWKIVNKPFTIYKHWLINIGLKRYFDFYSNNVNSTIIKEYDGYYNITFNLNSISDEIEFESIGDLNYEEKIYKYNVVSESTASNTALLNELKEIKGVVSLALYVILLVLSYFILFFNSQKYKVTFVYIANILLLIYLLNQFLAITDSTKVLRWLSIIGIFLNIAYALIRENK